MTELKLKNQIKYEIRELEKKGKFYRKIIIM